jgi:hypothetical protein
MHHASQQLREPRLEERDTGLREEPYPLGVGVYPKHFMSDMRYAGRMNGSQISGTDNRDAHCPTC